MSKIVRRVILDRILKNREAELTGKTTCGETPDAKSICIDGQEGPYTHNLIL